MTESQLDDLLCAAAETPALPARLSQRVWSEIELRQLSEGNSLWWPTRLAAWMVQPIPRRILWLLAAALGAAAGLWPGSKAPLDPLAVYAHSINPAHPTIAP